VLFENLAIVAFGRDSIARPGAAQTQARTEVPFKAEQAANVGRAFILFDGLGIGFGNAHFLCGYKGIQHPSHDGGPTLVTGSDDRSQRFFGHHFRQDNVLLWVGHKATRGSQ